MRTFLGPAFISLLLILCTNAITAQHVRVQGGFMADSLRIGDEVFFYLSAHSNKKDQVIFPDSTFDYAPFELLDKEYFATRTRDSISIDSAVYHLATFEVDEIQALRLPVFRISARDDSAAYFSPLDSIKVQMVVKDLPEQISEDLPVRATIGYQQVPLRFNYPILIIGFTLLLVLAAVTWFTFGERIQRHYRIKRMKRSHAQFVEAFNSKLNGLSTRFSRSDAEDALVLWKRYMEGLNQVPYTRLTTPELQKTGTDKPVIRSLQQLDAAIYGYGENVRDAFSELRNYTEARFERKINEEKNG